LTDCEDPIIDTVEYQVAEFFVLTHWEILGKRIPGYGETNLNPIKLFNKITRKSHQNKKQDSYITGCTL